jgi:hypothetical protein
MASVIGNMNISSGAMTQVNLISEIPMTTLRYWPGYITFALIDTLQGVVASALPGMGGGLTGSIYNGATRGFFKTLQFVTWDAIKSVY